MAATTLASTVVDTTLTRLSEDPTAPRYWSREEILDLVWEGLLEATLVSGHLQESVNLTLTGNSVQAAPNHVAILHIRVGNNSMQKYSIDDLDSAKPTWDSDPQSVNPSIWAAIGTTKVLTHPRTTATGKVVVCTVLEFPPVLAESDVIPLEDEYVEALANYAFSVARLKEGGAEFRDSMVDYDRYLERIGLLAERVAWKNAPEWTKTPKTVLSDAVPLSRRRQR